VFGVLRTGVTFFAISVSDAAEDVIGVIRAGARGYVAKSIAPADLIAALRRVREGDAVFSPRLAVFSPRLAVFSPRLAVFSPRLAVFVLDAFSGARPPSPDRELDQLTTREREVLRHIARG
jgi:DNA-binding NarL/FixJ family response regulator